MGLAAGLLPGLILLLACRREITLTYALSQDAKNDRLRYRALAILLAACGFCGFLIALSVSGPFLHGGWMAWALLTGCVAAAHEVSVRAAPLRITACREDGWFRISGCGKAFLRRLSAAEPRT